VKTMSVLIILVLSMATALFAQDKSNRSSKAFSLCGSIATDSEWAGN